MILSYAGRKASFNPSNFEFHPLEIEKAGLTESDELRSDGAGCCRQEQDLPANKETGGCQKRLERLVLNVANYCNLNCVYCYAGGGDYGGPRETMTLEVGKSALQKFLRLYDEISTIQFFGGEPLLNWGTIKELCACGWELADSLGKKRPVYAFVSNGTVLNPEIVEMIRKYDIKVTNSLDGPPHINDRLRITRSNEGTSSLIENNIKWLKRETGQPGQIEGTYTRLHVQERCSVTDVMDYIQSELGVGLLHMPVNAVSSTSTQDKYALVEDDLGWVLQSYSDAIARSFRSLVTDPVDKATVFNTALEIVAALLNPQKSTRNYICSAGSGTVAVDSNGDVYPCFMFYRQRAFHIGSVIDPAQPVIDKDKKADFLKPIAKSEISNLSSSWAQKFLHGCAGGNFFKSADYGNVLDFEVLLTEAMVSAAVVELAHLRQDRGRWDYLPKAIALFNLYLNAPL